VRRIEVPAAWILEITAGELLEQFEFLDNSGQPIAPYHVTDAGNLIIRRRKDGKIFKPWTYTGTKETGLLYYVDL
jgi:hypothetical protein